MSAIPMRFLNLASAVVAAAATLMAASPVVAEDTELFVGEAVTHPRHARTSCSSWTPPAA